MLVRGRGRDLPALALVAARAMARRPFGAVFGWPLAVLGWPVWLALLILLSRHLWRLERRAVIAIHAPADSRFPAWHLLGAPLVIGTAMGVSLVLWPPSFWLGVGSVATFLVVYAGLYPGRLVAGPRVTQARPPLRISLAASVHRGSGLLHCARVHVTAGYPSLPGPVRPGPQSVDELVAVVHEGDEPVVDRADHQLDGGCLRQPSCDDPAHRTPVLADDVPTPGCRGRRP